MLLFKMLQKVLSTCYRSAQSGSCFIIFATFRAQRRCFMRTNFDADLKYLNACYAVKYLQNNPYILLQTHVLLFKNLS